MEWLLLRHSYNISSEWELVIPSKRLSIKLHGKVSRTNGHCLTFIDIIDHSSSICVIYVLHDVGFKNDHANVILY